MNEHADRWIDAYLDGEMPAGQRHHAEAHLAQCPACRELLARRSSLSALLQEAPATAGFKPEKQFLAEVGLQLPRQPTASLPRSQTLSLAWYAVPVGLLLVLAFTQVVFILNTALALIPGAPAALLSQTSALTALPVTLPAPVNDLLGQTALFNLADWGWLTGPVIFVLVGLLYLGWLASWWARSRHSVQKSL
jgi:anti-sigma factor RsiW